MASNSILTNDVILRESLMALKNHIVFTKGATREYSKEFAKSGAKVGNTINIRKPVRYEVTEGATLNIQGSQDQSMPLVLDKHFHVGLAFSEVDRTLSLDKFRERYIDNAMIAMGNKIDSTFFADMVKQVGNSVGVPSPSALPNSMKPFSFAKAKIASLGGPKGIYSAVLDPLSEASLIDGQKSLFQSSEKIADQYESGEMGLAGGMRFAMSQNVPKHTAGAPVGTPKISTTVTTNGTATLALDGITGSITNCYKKGDSIQIANVYSVNPQTKENTGELAQFVVTADTNSSSGSIASLPISPAIVLDGPYKNVNRAPTDEDAVTLFGHATNYAGIVAPQNLVYHKSAFAFGSADFELPDAGVKASRVSDEDAGISLMMCSQYDITNHRTIHRIDFLGGWKCVYQELAARVVGQLS
jgi:hypothetical protein